jgi:hypothetical protein
MRKIVSLVLIVALCISCLAFRGYAAENEEVESGIVDALSSVEPIKEQFGLSSVDFDQLTTSNHIFAYDYTNTGCVYNAEFIPLKFEGELVGWVIKAPGDGGNIYQFSTAFVEAVNNNLDALTEFAIIYDAQSSYLYNGVDLIKLKDTGITVDARAEVTEVLLIDAGVVLNNIDANYDFEYINNVPNARTSSVISCNVSAVLQGNASICWAASAACIINYIQGTSYDAISVAKNWYGNTNYNQMLPLDDTDNVLARYNIYYSYREQEPSEAVILHNIASGYPVLATFITTDAYVGWHDVVIYGVNPIASKLYIMDPTIGFTVATHIEYVGYRYYNSTIGEGINLTLYHATCKYWTT